MKFYKLFILFTLFLCSVAIQAQELLEDEKAMFKEARKAYSSGEFIEAVRLFSHLSSVDNKNTTYQYYLGISFLNAKDDRSKAIEYLEFAATDPETPVDVHYYLAQSYHLSNRFDDAISAYNKFKGLIKKSDSRIASINREIEMCNNAKVHVQNHQKVLIATKKKISTAPAYGHYDISALGGKVIRTPDHYKSKEDVKNNVNDILFMAFNKDKLFYTSKDEGGQGGKDIFVVNQLPNKEWALPQNIGEPINSPYDEDSPTLHPDGKTLYFSSKGHNSMGGYDIFRSEFVEQEYPQKGYWTKPQNLGYPINSAGDDNFFIADFDQEYAYFSSGRETNPGRMEVYKIKLPKSSISNTVVKGFFTNNNDTYPNKAKISIVDKITDELVGVFNTDPMNGEFLLLIPPGREYRYLIEAEGFMPRVQDITIPPQLTLYPIYQEISLNGTELSEELAFVNDFSNPYVETEVDEDLEEEFKVAGTVGRQKFSNTFAYEDRNKMQAVQLANRIVMIPSSDLTSLAPAGAKDVQLLASAPIGEKTETGSSDRSSESTGISDDQSEVIAQNEVDQQGEIEYAEAEEYETISLGTIVLGDETEPSMAQAEPSIDVIVAFAEELRNSSQQNAIDAEIAFNNAKELKVIAEEFKAEAVEAEKELESISSDKEKEQKLEEVKELEEAARDKWQEARQSYDYANDLKKEAERKAVKANEATTIVEKIQIEQHKEKNKTPEEFVYTDEQLQQIELYSHEYSRELKSEANQKEQKATIAFDYSKKLRQQALDLYDEADQIIADADDIKNESKKEAEIKRGEQMKEEAEDLSQEAIVAVTYAEELKAVSVRKNNESAVMKSTASAVQELYQSSDNALSYDSQIINEEVSSESENLQEYELAYVAEVEYIAKKEVQQTGGVGEFEPEKKQSRSSAGIDKSVSSNEQIVSSSSSKANRKKNKKGSKKVENADPTIVSSNEKGSVDDSSAEPVEQTFAYESSSDGLAMEDDEEDDFFFGDEDDEDTDDFFDVEDEADNAYTSENLSSESSSEGSPNQTGSREIASYESSSSSEGLNSTYESTAYGTQTSESSSDVLTSSSVEEDIAINDDYNEDEEFADMFLDDADNEDFEDEEFADMFLDDADDEYVEDDADDFFLDEIEDGISEEEFASIESSDSSDQLVAESSSEESKAASGKSQKRSKKNLKTGVDDGTQVEESVLASTSEDAQDITTSATESSKDEDLAFEPSIETETSTDADDFFFDDANDDENEVAYHSEIPVTSQEISSGNESLRNDQSDAEPESSTNEGLVIESSLETEMSSDDDDFFFDDTSEDDEDVAFDSQTSTQGPSSERFGSGNGQSDLQTGSDNIVNDGSLSSEGILESQEESVLASGSSSIELDNETTFDNSGEQQTSNYSQDITVNKSSVTSEESQQITSSDDSEIAYQSESPDNNTGSTTTSGTNQTETSKGGGGISLDLGMGGLFGSRNKKKSKDSQSQSNEQLAYNEQNTEPDTDGSVTESTSSLTEEEPISSRTQTGSSMSSAPSISYNIEPINIEEAASEMTYKPEEELFVFSTVDPVTYSKEKPIPVNKGLPEGLVFKVQIGAFKNPIPQDLFGNLSPLMAETTPMGFKRYSVGLFRAYESANLARREVQNIGYDDAFVVSFFNGKRITLREALAILQESGADIQMAYKNIADKEKEALAQIGINDNKYADAQNIIPVKYELPEGTFFKVQIGAFSNPVTKDKFPQFNVDDISGDLGTGGLIRYTLGLFDDYESAYNYRNNEVISVIPDAFIVVYKDGARVPLSDAYTVKTILTSNTEEPEETEFRIPFVAPVKPKDVTEPASSAEMPSSKGAPIYVIQVGSFKNGIVPKSFMELVNQLSNVSTETSPVGYKRYLVGKYDSFEAAMKQRSEYINQGIKDAFVVAYYNGERLTIPEAQKFLNK